MPPAVSAVLADILARQRERFNYRFVEARRAWPRLEAEAFMDVLRFTLAPVVEAVHAAAPDRAPEATEVLFDLALDLTGQDLLGPGARYPALTVGWGTILPRLGRFLAEAPRRVAGAITNALYHLARTPGARPEMWAGGLLELAGVCPDGETLLRAGQVAAWRAGLAHLRRPALEIARGLPAPIARAALGLPPGAAEATRAIDRLAADPWLPPALAEQPAPTRRLALVGRVGAFRGFGGLFLRPPILEPAAEGFLVSDGEGVWLLAADACGATFQRVAGVPSLRRPTPFALLKDGTVRAGDHSARFPELAEAASHAADGQTLAVTVPLSHAVHLVALQAA